MRIDKAKQFIMENARAYERALYRYFFQNGSKDSVIKNEPGMENNISVQDILTETKETPAAALITEFDKSGEYDQKDIEDTEDIGPDY